MAAWRGASLDPGQAGTGGDLIRIKETGSEAWQAGAILI
jgi:hypothetical protein